MKALLLAVTMMLGLLSFNANAVVLDGVAATTTTTSSSSVGVFGGSFAMPVALIVFAIMTQEEYRACSDGKYLEGKFSDGKSNHSFSIEPCDYLDNPSKYTLKSS